MTIRSTQQQKGLEVYCRLVSEKFNELGLDKITVLQHKAIPVDWNQESVKSDILKNIMKATCFRKDGTPKTSTTELNVDEVGIVYENMNRWTANSFGFSMEFPTEAERQES